MVLVGGLAVGVFGSTVRVQAHHYPLRACEVVRGNVPAVGACKDENARYRKNANQNFINQIKANPQICNSLSNAELKHYGVFAVAACKDINASYKRQYQRGVVQGIRNGNVQLPYKYIPQGHGGYAPNNYRHTPTRHCDFVDDYGVCYRRRY